ncbi:MAG: hypothetical protein HY866_14035 [Chloroflexi bacterium]|nr:hypothetical protein [Chloroflexota bacterium]
MIAIIGIIGLVLVTDPKEENSETNSAELTKIAAAYLTATVETWTPVPTPTAPATATLTFTPTFIPTWTLSSNDTPAAMITPLPNATGLPVTPQSQVLYATGNANLRPCPQITEDCAPAAEVQGGKALTGTGMIFGESIGATALWYQINYVGQMLYIHSSMVTMTRPEAPVVEPPPIQPQPAAVSPFGCNGRNDLDCSDFYAIGQSANAHLAQCGDEDHIDGDGDGRACERW